MKVSFDITMDNKIMLKYKDGADLEDEDEPYVRELCSVGLMKTGISIKRKKVTAKTTGTGLGLLGIEPHYFVE